MHTDAKVSPESATLLSRHLGAACLSELLPLNVSAFETRAFTWNEDLFPDEVRSIANSIRARQIEFRTGRYCARNALRQLGVPSLPIPVGPNREPIWPSGYIGSITHCSGYCAAAVAREDCLYSLGIDAEPCERLPHDIADRVITANEYRAFQAFAFNKDVLGKLVFSAKESIFKAWFPVTGLWLDFLDVEVQINQSLSAFSAHLIQAPEQGLSITGRFRITQDVILTAATISRTSDATTYCSLE